jgi:hypothetical protein
VHPEDTWLQPNDLDELLEDNATITSSPSSPDAPSSRVNRAETPAKGTIARVDWRLRSGNIRLGKPDSRAQQAKIKRVAPSQKDVIMGEPFYEEIQSYKKRYVILRFFRFSIQDNDTVKIFAPSACRAGRG